jgi:hypothetical protein
VRLPYFNPHSFSETLALLNGQRRKTPEEYKAWSQNLGPRARPDDVLQLTCHWEVLEGGKSIGRIYEVPAPNDPANVWP